MTCTKVIIAFGCNVGDCPKNIKESLKRLERKVFLKKVSSIYLSQPYGVKNQPPFYNGVVLGYTNLTPYRLLEFLKTIERQVGRKPRCRWCEREIDLDIVYYGSLTIQREDLKIPHPDRLNRDFVLVPLLEVEPTFKDPILGISIKNRVRESFKENRLEVVEVL
ncbi:MAG: 2-amino-4-hydroxy-6-hydroxymethyldihydropteridine diphosphokinase [Aquificae bacterium]|nr:2-amino-4-hydroxy-6-hydroxymethyldihydropteridine diphosphokinase [Aquificota bacterium]